MNRLNPGPAPRGRVAARPLAALVVALLPAFALAAPRAGTPIEPVYAPETPWHVETNEISMVGAGVDAFFEDGGWVEAAGGEPMWGIGLLVDGEGVERLTWQGQDYHGRWSRPARVEVTWSEGKAHVARAQFSQPMRRVRLRRNGAEVDFSQVEPLLERRPANLPLARQMPQLTLLQHKADVSTLAAPLPPGVISRAQWGARNTGSCGSAHNPDYLTVHHTSTPNNDSLSPAARMRQMQAFHIDTRGWCDFAYHFTVGIDGKVYQGRNPDETGAHVGNWNTGNVGVSVVGTFIDFSPRQSQLDALTSISRWIVDRYAIPKSRNNIRGHKEWPGHTSNDCPGLLLPWLPTLVSRLQGGGGGGGTTTGVLEGFESTQGRFDSAPTASGSTVGIATASTSFRSNLQAKNGTWGNQLYLKDNAASSADWFVRLLSNGGAPAQNTAMQKGGGRLGAWFFTAASGVNVSFAVDDSDGTERSVPRALPANAWTFVEVKLDDQAQWDAWAGGNGTITAASVTLDSIVVQRANTSFDVYVYLDDVSFRVQ